MHSGATNLKQSVLWSCFFVVKNTILDPSFPEHRNLILSEHPKAIQDPEVAQSPSLHTSGVPNCSREEKQHAQGTSHITVSVLGMQNSQ
jgi:hypothetical protein